jgi:hypothetical protein
MPEQLTKHPEVTLQVLRSGGAKCAEGGPQSILTQCPMQRFCKLPGGELCVYGLDEAHRMTQISTSDWQAIQQALQLGSTPDAVGHGPESFVLGGVGVLVGAVVAVLVMRRRQP